MTFTPARTHPDGSRSVRRATGQPWYLRPSFRHTDLLNIRAMKGHRR